MTLDYAALIYDFVLPLVMFGNQARYHQEIISLLELRKSDRILDLGCGTGVLTRLIAGHLDARAGGIATGIDAAAKMIVVAQKRRGTRTCRFEIAAAENLPFEDESFEGVVSSLFFHHVPLDLKQKAMAEAFRVLVPGGRLVVADIHTPSSLLGSLTAHVARLLHAHSQIEENMQGVLPILIAEAGFLVPRQGRTYGGYITVFASTKPKALA